MFMMFQITYINYILTLIGVKSPPSPPCHITAHKLMDFDKCNTLSLPLISLLYVEGRTSTYNGLLL